MQSRASHALLMLLLVSLTAAGRPTAGLAADARRESLHTLHGYFPFEPPATADAWARRREAVRRRVAVALGLWPEPTRNPLRPAVHGTIDRGDHTIDRVVFESLPGFYVTGNLYRPKGATGPRPAVLFAHGHWADARLAEMTPEQLRQEIATGAERFEQGGRSVFQALCVQLARMGCVVWQWDMLGDSDALQITRDISHGFRRQRPEMNDPDAWGLYSPQAEARLQSVLGLQTWNAVRSLDYVLSLPEVDPARIACTGASGGGTQTMLLGAVDDRLALSYPVVMVSTAMQGGCTCENASLLRVGTGNVEFAALFAPKPQGMNTANDWTRELATKGFPQLVRLYEMLGAKGAVALQRGEHFRHNYNAVTRSGFYTFLNGRFQLGLESPVIERDYEPLPRSALTVWDDAHPAPPAGDPAFERRLLRGLSDDAEAQVTAAAATAAGLDGVLRPAVEVLVGRTLAEAGDVAWEVGDKADSGDHQRIDGVLRNRTHGEEVAVRWLRPRRDSGDAVIWLGDAGRGAAAGDDGRPLPAVAGMLAAGATVITADLFRQEEPAPVRNRAVDNGREAACFTYGYNHPLVVQRVHDVLSIVRSLREGDTAGHPRPTRVLLVATGGMASVAAAARAVAGPALDRAAIDTAGFRFASLRDHLDGSFLPGAVRYLDLPGLLAVGSPGPLWLAGEGPAAPEVVAKAYAARGATGALDVFAGEPAGALEAAARFVTTPAAP
jgi:dienelactone hydrolase